jgi:hypothetical protein
MNMPEKAFPTTPTYPLGGTLDTADRQTTDLQLADNALAVLEKRCLKKEAGKVRKILRFCDTSSGFKRRRDSS